MNIKDFITQLEESGVPDDHVINFTISDMAEVMHYHGTALDDAMKETGFISEVSSFIFHGPLYREDDEIVKDLLESDAVAALSDEWFDDEAEDPDAVYQTEEYKEALQETLEEEFHENWYEYDLIDYNLIQYDYKRGRVDLSFTRSLSFSFLKEHSDWFPLCEASVDLPNGFSLSTDLD